MATQGISGAGRAELTAVAGRRRFVTPDDVAAELEVDPSVAAKKLAHWADSGWLRRVRRGLYIPVPVEAERPSGWSDDPLVVATEVWAPCYFTGWTAASHWGLTEQVFRTTVLKTTRRVRAAEVAPARSRLPRHPRRGESDDVGASSRVWHEEIRLPLRRPGADRRRHPRRAPSRRRHSTRSRDPRRLPRRPRRPPARRVRRSARQPRRLQAPGLPARIARTRPARADRRVPRVASRPASRCSTPTAARRRSRCPLGPPGQRARRARGARRDLQAGAAAAPGRVAARRWRHRKGLRARMGCSPRSPHEPSSPQTLDLQGRHLPAQVLLRDLPVLRGPRLHRHRRRPRGAGRTDRDLRRDRGLAARGVRGRADRRAQIAFAQRRNLRGNPTIQGRIAYRGPNPPPTLPKLKLDITSDEVLVETPVLRSDRATHTATAPPGRRRSLLLARRARRQRRHARSPSAAGRATSTTSSTCTAIQTSSVLPARVAASLAQKCAHAGHPRSRRRHHPRIAYAR